MFIFNIIQIVQDAVTDIFKKYRTMMENLAYSLLKDHQLSEDAVQEAIIKLSKNTDKIDNINSNASKNYIYTVTKNEALKILEKKIDRNELFMGIQSFEEDESKDIAGALDIEAFCDKYGFGIEISDILQGLNATDKDIIIYKYGAGHSLKEIAELMDLDREVVYKRHQRALGKLKAVLEAENEK